MGYTELQITTNFSFLRGASHPEELVEHAHALGYTKIAITDRNTFAGIVRAHAAAKKKGIGIIPGCRLDLLDGPSLLALPSTKNGYSKLSNLLSRGNLRADKGECFLYQADVFEFSGGIKFIMLPPDTLNETFEFESEFEKHLHRYRNSLGSDLYIAASRRYQGDDGKQLYRIFQLSEKYKVPMVATNDVHYHEPARRQLQDVVTCIREKCTIYNAGFRLHANAERFLKPMDEMERLFRQYPEAISRTLEISEACQFSLDELKYEYPVEITSEGRTPQEELTYLSWQGAKNRFGENIPKKMADAINHELFFIEKMNYAAYFLTVYDIVKYARAQGILCQGRGSAANSTVCYCLGITSVNPTKFDLLFERFISDARNEPPDIDVDFEHERREEVIQYIYQKYGRDRAAIVATVTQQHQKGSLRDVAKAMGLSADTINRLSGSIWDFSEEWFDEQRLTEQGMNPNDKHLRKTLGLTRQFMGFPRQLGQHTGGFVITNGKLSDLCPILNARMQNRTCIEWNKDDIDALGFMKIDVLALGMLTCIRKAFNLAKKHYGLNLTLANIPEDDMAVYDMICKADTIGVFQIESRAQQSMLPRLKPRCFYDLVIEVAIVRPGPIQGDMVHPYLRRRNGEELVEYPSKDLEEILKRTLGVPLFQEQAMKIAIKAAGFTPAEADELRRSMATFKAKGLVSKFQKKLVDGMLANGYTHDYAQRVFKQLEGFGSYGFPESHAASFALLVYVSCWLKCYYPDVFCCAILNSMPMGFYQPAQLVMDARNHGVLVKPVDINYSQWDNILEDSPSPSLLGEGQGGALRIPSPQSGEGGGGEFFSLPPGNRGVDKITAGEVRTPSPLSEEGAGGEFFSLPPGNRGVDKITAGEVRIPSPLSEEGAGGEFFSLPPGNRGVDKITAGEVRIPSPQSGEGAGGEVRLGFRQVKGLRQDDIAILLAARAEGFIHVNQLRKAGVPEAALEKLADADAFRSLNLDRRKALWELFAKDKPGALFEDLPPESVHEHIQLPVMTDSEHVVHDYATTALSLKAHPVSFVRERLSQHNILATKALSTLQNGVFVQVAGLVLVRQRPGTAKGVCFMTIEDETGVANLVIFQNLFDLYRKEILQSRLIMVKGKLQREGDVIHIIVSSCFNMSKLLRQLTPASNEQLPLLTLSRADEKSVPANPDSRMRASENAGEKVIHGGRNFK